ncbi:MAG: DUF2147 domain-containing protein [Bacteroidetes bacterium]|nr:DUF2147 domain-containing protein [Bacteroidota bacterium]
MNIITTHVKFLVAFFSLIVLWQARVVASPNADLICGKWMSAEKNLTVDIYRVGNEFRARITWFKGEPGRPMETWLDSKNPNPALRKRKVLGTEILRGLEYEPGSNSWEDGLVYDAKHGHEWDAAAYIDEGGLLHVRGYWHFKIFGKTMVFHRVN